MLNGTRRRRRKPPAAPPPPRTTDGRGMADDIDGKPLNEEEFERQRARTADRLAAARRELKNLRWWNRGSDRVQLEVEIASRQAALRGFDEKRKQLERMPPSPARLPLPGRDPDDLMPVRSLRPEPHRRQPLRREPPGLEL